MDFDRFWAQACPIQSGAGEAQILSKGVDHMTTARSHDSTFLVNARHPYLGCQSFEKGVYGRLSMFQQLNSHGLH